MPLITSNYEDLNNNNSLNNSMEEHNNIEDITVNEEAVITTKNDNVFNAYERCKHIIEMITHCNVE